jgi:hypothetical protein
MAENRAVCKLVKLLLGYICRVLFLRPQALSGWRRRVVTAA